MLIMDFIDIIYFAVGVLVGVVLTSLVDSMICDDCKEGENDE